VGKEVLYADPNYKQRLHDWMQTYNPKPVGEALEALKKKYADQREAYIEDCRKKKLEAKKSIEEA
jgi:predicted HicB family RNase H-like nuclease